MVKIIQLMLDRRENSFKIVPFLVKITRQILLSFSLSRLNSLFSDFFFRMVYLSTKDLVSILIFSRRGSWF